jgi:cyclase
VNLRIIPRLDIKGPNLVKGIHLEGLRVLGKPWDFAYKYYTSGADELLYMDIVASLYGRNNLSEIVAKTAENIFIPLTVGGGIRTLEDIKNLLRAGADKVAINTAAIRTPTFLNESAATFGSQCIVVSIEAKKIGNDWLAMTDNGRENTGREVLPWAREAVERGAGEVLITSIDREGTGTGYDLELIRVIAEAVPVPVIACGGCGRPEHLLAAVGEGRADALCASSLFHYHHLESTIDQEAFKDEGNIEFLAQKRGPQRFMSKRIMPLGLPEVKAYLEEAGVPCRWPERKKENDDPESHHSRLWAREPVQHRPGSPVQWGLGGNIG